MASIVNCILVSPIGSLQGKAGPGGISPQTCSPSRRSTLVFALSRGDKARVKALRDLSCQEEWAVESSVASPPGKPWLRSNSLQQQNFGTSAWIL